MFAVKGWNVDASLLKAQTTPFKTADDQHAGSASKKRKRESADSGNIVPAERNGAQLATADTKERKQKKTKQKHLPDDAVQPSTQATPGQHSNATAVAKLTKKEKRRLKNQAQTGELAEHDSATKTDGDELVTDKGTVKSSKAVKQQQHALSTQISTPTTKLTPMQAAMRQKLISARFRHLNETLYTAPSQQAKDLFIANPEMFEEYHAGFRQQVAVWPENPVDKMLQRLRERGAVRLQSQKKAFSKPSTDTSAGNALPRTKGLCTIVDCGCGDARLAATVDKSKDLQRLNLKVLSYDLHSQSPYVIKADIAALPLADGSVDVVIFCLALMGTNWLSFIEEAYRVLHWKGEVWIAEIKSRFGRVGKKSRVVEHSVGNRKKQAAITKASNQQRKATEEAAQQEALAVEVDGAEAVKSESDLQDFLTALERRGFVLKDGDQSIDMNNKMFVDIQLVKAAVPTVGKGADETRGGPHAKKQPSIKVTPEDEAKTLKPCLYKVR